MNKVWRYLYVKIAILTAVAKKKQKKVSVGGVSS